MTLASKKNGTDKPTTEYSVYIFHDHSKREECPADWEKNVTTKNKKRALARARWLYASNDYQKVEIKKKLHDPKAGLAIDQTFKIYEKRSWTPWAKANILAIGAVALGIIVLIAALSLLF